MKIKMGELADIMTGNTPSMKVNEYYDSNDIPFIKPDSFKSHFELKANSYISNKAESKARIVGANCILVSCIGIIGKVGITSQKVAFNQQINSLNVKPHYDTEYIAYNLLFNKERLQRICNSAVVPLINKTQFSNFEISINKDIIIQRDIKNKLNLLSSIINNNKKKLLLLDDIVKSRFDELFLNAHSIETMEIGELFEVGSSKRILQSELTTYGIPFYRVTDLINRINDRPVDIKQYVDELKYMTLIKEKYVPQAGDFLITARGTIGKIYEVKQNDKFYFQDGMITWLKRKNNYINNLFFMELVKTDWFRRQFYSSNNGTTISYLSITDTRHLKVLLPALNLQLQFAQEVYQINKLKSDVQKSIDETQLLMDSLMQEYFG